jgi:putative transposase
MRPAEVARELKVSRQSATVWHRAWQEEGVRGLRQAERAGRPGLLTTKELSKVQRALLKGPAAYGWHTELWTLERVADVIAMETGIRYTVGHVWKILRRLGWSWQKPARRAIERDEEAVARWVREEWPEIKNSLAGSRPGSSSRTKAEPR